MSDDRCRSIRQAATYFSVAPKKVRMWVRRGLLRAVDIGERRVELRIPPGAIVEFEQKRAAVKPRPVRRKEAVDQEVEALLA